MGNAVSVPVIEALTNDLLENNKGILESKSNAKSHTHLQFAEATTQAKIAKEYAFANADNRNEIKITKAQQSV